MQMTHVSSSGEGEGGRKETVAGGNGGSEEEEEEARKEEEEARKEQEGEPRKEEEGEPRKEEEGEPRKDCRLDRMRRLDSELRPYFRLLLYRLIYLVSWNEIQRLLLLYVDTFFLLYKVVFF